jgi:hypothetical protein
MTPYSFDLPRLCEQVFRNKSREGRRNDRPH